MTLNYSKKVMRQFLKPKNFGKIKNPDAIGKVGNPVCLPPEEKIYLNNQFQEIKNSKKNDIVRSHDSTENKIIRKTSKNHKGKLITIKNALGKTSLTQEHLIYALKVPKKDKYFRHKGKKTLIPSWYHAEHLEKGDIVLYPINKKVKDIKRLEINIQKRKYDFRSKNIPSKTPLNNDLMRLFGYFLSEGNIQEKPSKTYISFTLNIKETNISEDITKITKKLFDIDAITKKRADKNTLEVYIYQVHLAKWFKSLFGNGALEKKIPKELMELPLRKQEELIKGLWMGDGCINLNRKGPRANYVTISYQLAQQIKELLLRQEIIPSIYLNKEKISKWAKHKKAYRIHVGQRKSLIKLAKILKRKHNPITYETINSWIEKEVLFTPITKIETKNYSGKVYNLEIEKVHSYISEAIALHNCGDIMEMYLKINKKTKVIKQIKFQTYGCAAAIASTSMLTQLVKGKTLEQAQKLTMQDIKNSLNDLPKIKVHCSSLAIQALKKAIENYKKKNK